jgi:pimeloyl-ACP methyl ester carboxylesterase
MRRLYVETSLGNISYLYREGTYPLVFLHGLGGSGNNFMKLDPFLNPHFELFMLDMLGHGKSEKTMPDYTVATQCTMLDEFLSRTGIKEKKFGLVGNSYGGWVSLRFSISYGNPEFLILIDSAGINPTVGESGKENLENFIEKLMRVNHNNDRNIMTRISEQNSTGTEKIKLEELASIGSHTAIIWGEHDAIIPKKYGIMVNDHMPGSKFFTIKDGGHTPQSSNPEEVSSIIDEFIFSKS